VILLGNITAGTADFHSFHRNIVPSALHYATVVIVLFLFVILLQGSTV